MFSSLVGKFLIGAANLMTRSNQNASRDVMTAGVTAWHGAGGTTSYSTFTHLIRAAEIYY